MKNISKLMALSFLLITVLWACKKDEKKDYFLGGKPPVLTTTTNSSSADSLQLLYKDADKEALRLAWTNPNYQFTTGISSQDVTYQIQIDTAGSNFTNPQKKEISLTRDLSYSITEGEINDYMLNQLGLAPGMIHHLEIKLISSINTSAVPQTSNVVKIDARPYAIPPKVMPPASGKLFITGDATNGSWMVGGDPSSVPADQQFTKVSETEYVITIDLIGGKSYLLVPVAGDWGHKYAVKNNTVPATGGDFGYDFSTNFNGPSTSGTYKIDVDFQRGKFTVTKQ